MVSTSGTVSTTVFKTNKVIEHAFRRCKFPPEKITAQHIQTALDCLYLKLSDMANVGINLWTVTTEIIPLYQGQFRVDTPLGTVDILNLNLRDLQRTAGVYTSSEGTASYAFDGDLETACTQTTPGGNITAQYSSPTAITNIGILFQATATMNFVIETSIDGTTWTTIYSNDSYAAVAGKWLWIDLADPESIFQSASLFGVYYCRLRAIAPSILNITEFYIANTPREIPMALINRDDYANLPDHTFQGRPVEYWYNVQLNPPQLWIWPAADFYSTFRQIILYRNRYIQDVGTLGNLLEIPQRWFNSIIWDLSLILCDEVIEIPPGRKEEIRPDAEKCIKDAWGQETDRSPIYFRPNISPYTK